MFLKIVAVVAVLGACQAVEHAHSSQSIIVHHEHKEPEHHEHVKVVVPVVTKKVVPVAHYVVESSGHEHKQEHHHEHKPAISSQHIERHDVPAHPPKGWNDHHGAAKYEFEYKVQDPHTHDQKYQHEARDGHSVKGVYSLHEADGSVRTVHYSADKKTGFQADVKHETKHVEKHHHHH